MILEQGEPDEQKRTWKRMIRDEKLTARISCPICGLAATLEPDRATGHIVEEDGSVVPSIVCVGKDENGDPCAFHAYVKLRGWIPQGTGPAEY